MNRDAHGATAVAHVELSGSHAEMGRQHGAALADLIPAIVEHYRPASGLTPALEAALRGIEATLAADYPDLLVELRGIADGAGLPYDDILWLNAGYEAQGDALPRAPFDFASRSIPSGQDKPFGFAQDKPFCTALGLPNTPEGPLVAKTDDVAPEERGFEVLFRVRPANGLAHLCYAFGGTVWNQGGLNAAGLALAMTGLPPAGWRNPAGIPGLLLLRQILLRCATAEEALAYAAGHPLRGYGCTMTLADATGGDVVVAEMCGAAARPIGHSAGRGTLAVHRATLRPGSELAPSLYSEQALNAMKGQAREPTVRANHPRCRETIALEPDREWLARYGLPGLRENSEARVANAERLARETPWTVEGLKKLLGDHSIPGAICQHGQAGLHTSIAMIMIPWRRAMIVSEGYGCGTYAEYTI